MPEESIVKSVMELPVGILSFNKEWKIEFVNETYSRLAALYGLQKAEVSYSDLRTISPFASETLSDNLKTLAEGQPFETEIKNLKTADGREISLIVKGMPFFIENEFDGGVLVIEDMKILADSRKEALLKSEYLERILKEKASLLIVTDPQGIIQFLSGKLSANLKIPENGLKKIHVTRLFVNDINLINETFTKVRFGRKSEQIKTFIRFKDSIAHFRCTVTPVLNEFGRIRFIYFFLEDISEEESEIESLKTKLKNAEYYRIARQVLQDALFVIDKDGTIHYWDENASSLFSIPARDALGKQVQSIIPTMTSAMIEKIIAELTAAKSFTTELTFPAGGGVIDKIKLFSVPAREHNKIILLCSRSRDSVSEEKSGSEILTRKEYSCELTPEGKFGFISPELAQLLVIREDAAQNIKISNLIADSPEKNLMSDPEKLAADNIRYLKLNFITIDGRNLELDASLSPAYDLNGKLLSIHCVLTQELRKESDTELYKSIISYALDGLILSLHGKIIIANDAFAEMFGFSSSGEIIENELLDFVDETDILKVSEFLRLKERKKDAPGRIDFLSKKKDGTRFYAEASVSSFTIDDKNYLVIILRDVTERKRVQKVLKDSEEKYRSITENIDDFLFTYERSGNYLRPVFYTAAVEKITGYSQTDFLSDSKLFLKIIYPDDLPDLKKKIKHLMRSKIQDSGEFEFRVINKLGNIVWVRAKINLIRNSEGIIQKVYGLVSDITYRKRAEDELRKSTENLVKLNETKDRFISIISHDLRTPFSSILGFTDLLSNDEDLTDEERKQYVKYIQDSSRSMLALVNSLLDWTRLQTGRIKFEPQKLSAAAIVESSVKSLSGAAIQKKIEITASVPESLSIFADKNLIMQVFNNLISNAIKFTPPGGNIWITAAHSETHRFVVFSVKDNGVGIKEENISKLFSVDTKFTSEGTSGEKGSGLGLSLVSEIIEKHGGKIWVESKYGEGSDFRFVLPIASSNILLVDPNKTESILYSKILRNISPDYNVDVVQDGKAALEKVKESPPALVISEHNMPHLSGYELVKQLRRMEIPNVPPVIILSSKIDRNAIQDYTDIGVEYVFQKPVNLGNFKQAVEKSLKRGLSG